MNENKTIAQVVKDELCTGCGTCVSLCPEEAIEMVINEQKGIYVPELNEEKCSDCGTCYKVCPGHEVDFKQLNLEIFGKEPDDILIGNYLNCYVGHATDYDIRYNSASGGLVTALLIYMLEEGLIDGALVTRMKKDKPLEPEPFIARTKEEIIEASKSKYCPVPANVALRVILESKEGARFAVVGLPCHIHGLRKAQQVNEELKERVVVCLGIFCGHAPNFWGTEFILQQRMFSKDDANKIYYRSEGWPGGMTIKLKDKSEIFYPHHEYWKTFGLRFFTSARCMVCCDGIAELADICFGDAWLPELADDTVGKSVIVAKTKSGENTLQNAISNGCIELKETSNKEIIRSQASMINFKKTLKSRISLFKIVGKATPIYSCELSKPKIADYLRATLYYLHMHISRKRYLWYFIPRIISLEWCFRSRK